MANSKRGFAAMSPEKQRMIASLGGKAAHVHGTAHRFTREEAVIAGRKGGAAPRAAGARKKIAPPPDATVPASDTVPAQTE